MARIENAQRRANTQNVAVMLITQGIEDIARMTKAGGFNEQHIGLFPGNQHIQAHLERQAGHAAQAAARHFFHHRALRRQNGAIDADFAKLIHQHGPFFMGRLVLQQVQNGGGFANAQKTGNQVGADHNAVRNRKGVTV